MQSDNFKSTPPSKPLHPIDGPPSLEEIVREYLPNVKPLAQRMVYKMGLPKWYVDEFTSIGHLGLVVAAKTYDHNISAGFCAYASVVIRNHIIDYLRRSYFSSHLYQKVRNKAPSPSLSYIEVESISANGPTPEKIAERRQIATLLKNAVSHLDKDEQEVLIKYYIEGRPLTELVRVGRKLPAVSKLHTKTLQKIRLRLIQRGVQGKDLSN